MCQCSQFGDPSLGDDHVWDYGGEEYGKVGGNRDLHHVFPATHLNAGDICMDALVGEAG